MKTMSVTIDIEDWYHVPAVCSSSFSKYKDTEDFFSKWNGKYDYLTEPTMQTLDLLDELDIHATFFIVAEVVNRYPGLVKAIGTKGHEIACHGYNHMCYINARTRRPIHSREFFLRQMELAKKTLERETSQHIIGFRAPAAYVTGWMIDVIESLGFKYDSSVSSNSLYNKTDSKLKGVGRMPYFPEKGGIEPGPPRGLLEIPWPYYEIGPIRIPSAGGPFLRFLGARFILEGIKQSLRSGSSLLYFHPLDISHEIFPSEFSWRRPFYWLVKGRIVEDRIRWLLSKLDVEYVTMSEQAKRWTRMLCDFADVP